MAVFTMRFDISASNKLLRQTALLGLLLSLGQPVVAGDISDLLNNMSQADQNLNYKGTFVLRKSDRMMSMRVNHAADDRGVRESLETLNGENRRVISDNGQVLSIYPLRNLLIVSNDIKKSRLHPTLPENLDKLQVYYDIEQQADDRIANHETAVLRLTPKDDHRYGYRYWVDADKGVLLRCDLIGDNESVIEQMMFTQLEYVDALPDELFSYPGIDDFDLTNLNKDRIQLETVPWAVRDLPAGFMLTQSSMRKDDVNQAIHMVYSDGLASVSVFVERGEDSNHYLEGASSMGALNAYGTKQGDYYVTVMGEVPASTIKQIAISTRRDNDKTISSFDD